MFSYDQLEFRYEPFPIGVAKPALAQELYRELVDSYPPQELFPYIPKIGNKYSLSERYQPDKYRTSSAGSPLWRDFHRWIKSDAFIPAWSGPSRRTMSISASTGGARAAGCRSRQQPRQGQYDAGGARLSARFEFSMLPADGGYVIPHTDAPGKLITLVVSMVGGRVGPRLRRRHRGQPAEGRGWTSTG